MKFIVNSSGLDNNFGKLKDPVTFADSTKKPEIWIKEAMRKYIKEINKSEKEKKEHWLILVRFLKEESILLNL